MVGMQIWFWSLLQIESLQWIGGGSNIVDALRSVRLDVLGSVSNRPGVEGYCYSHDRGKVRQYLQIINLKC